MAATVTIKVELADRVIAKLAKLEDFVAEGIVTDVIGAVAEEEVYLRIQPYPTPGPWTKAKGLLGSRWTIDQARKLEVTIENLTEYAGWVQGEVQRHFHAAHGWVNAVDQMQKAAAGISARVGRAIREIINGP